MEHLDEISVEELQDALDKVEGKKPTQRLLAAAIAYKNGLTQTELAEWYDVQRRTIYSWLKRLDTDESLEQAVTDAHRSGKEKTLRKKSNRNSKKQSTNLPKKLTVTRRRGRRRLSNSILTRRTVSSTHSRAVGGCSKSGIELSKPRRTAAESEAEEQETFRNEIKKATGNGRHSSLYRSKPKKSVQVEPRAAWFPRAARGRLSNCLGNATGRVS